MINREGRQKLEHWGIHLWPPICCKVCYQFRISEVYSFREKARRLYSKAIAELILASCWLLSDWRVHQSKVQSQQYSNIFLQNMAGSCGSASSSFWTLMFAALLHCHMHLQEVKNIIAASGILSWKDAISLWAPPFLHFPLIQTPMSLPIPTCLAFEGGEKTML